MYFAFEHGVTLSMIKVQCCASSCTWRVLMSWASVQIWNYTKRPERGASCVQVWLDGLLIYSGALRRAPAAPVNARASATPVASTEFAQALIFTDDAAIVRQHQTQVQAFVPLPVPA